MVSEVKLLNYKYIGAAAASKILQAREKERERERVVVARYDLLTFITFYALGRRFEGVPTLILAPH